MAVIVLASAGHAPGVTSTALGLTLTWPHSVMLADCDRVPTQSVLAGYLQGVDAGHSGLGRLLQVHRERRPMEAALNAETLQLTNSPIPADADISRTFLPGFPHPGVVGLFQTAWPDLLAAFGALGTDVIIDAGRIGAEGLPAPLIQGADAVLVVTRASLVSLAALRLFLPLVTEAAGSTRSGLLLVGEGRPYGRGEVEAQFGATVWASVDHDVRAAAVLSDGAMPGRRFADTGFVRSLRTAADAIAGRVSAARSLIGAPR